MLECLASYLVLLYRAYLRCHGNAYQRIFGILFTPFSCVLVIPCQFYKGKAILSNIVKVVFY